MEEIYVKTRKLTMANLENVSKWLDENATGPVKIRGAHYRTFIQQYCGENDGNKKIHVLKVSFFNETDARHFLMAWG
jgi:hypothetical protein